MVDRAQLPKDPHLAERVLQADAEKQVRDMGKIGLYFGSRENAAIYLASALIILALIIAVGIAYSDPSLRPDLLKAALGLIAIAAGYIFGSVARSKD